MPKAAPEEEKLRAAVRRAAKKAAAAKEARDDAIRAAFDAGVSRAAIAKDSGISVPRVYQIIDGR